MQDIILNPRPVGILYNAVTQAAAGVSLTGQGVKVLQIQGLAAAQVVTIQTRLSDDANWVDYQVVPVDKPAVVVEFGSNLNRVRVTGLVAGHMVLAQG